MIPRNVYGILWIYIYGQSNDDGSCGDFDIEVGDLLKGFKLIYQKRHLCVGYLKRSNYSNSSCGSFTKHMVETLQRPEGTSGFPTTVFTI